MTTYPNKDKVR